MGASCRETIVLFFKIKRNRRRAYYEKNNYSFGNLSNTFFVGVIQWKDKAISDKIIGEIPYMGMLHESGNNKLITDNGDYVLGVFGYLTDEDAASSFPKIKLEERQNFIEAY